MVGYPFTDEVSHQFMGLVSPTDADGNPNPCYDVTPKFDDVQCTGRGTAGRVAIREGYIRSAYEDADEKLGITRKLMGGNPTTFAGSDHGFAPQYYAVNANAVLNAATVNGVRHERPTPRTARERRERRRTAAPRTDRHRQGVLGRRHDPDLRQHDAARRGTHRYAAGPRGRRERRSRTSPTRRTRASRSSSRS